MGAATKKPVKMTYSLVPNTLPGTSGYHRALSHIDSKDGPVLGTINVGKSGSLERFKTFTTGLSKTAGVHDLYFVFHGEKGAELMKLDWWKME